MEELIEVLTNAENYASSELVRGAMEKATQCLKNYLRLEKEFENYDRWSCQISERYALDKVFEIMRENMYDSE